MVKTTAVAATYNGPTISSTIAAATCPFTYELQLWTGSSWIAGQPTFVSNFDPSNGQITVLEGDGVNYFDAGVDNYLFG